MNKFSENFLISAYIAIIILVGFYFFILFKSQKKPKDELAKHYKVSKPTLIKWVRYFKCPLSLDQWKRKRKLTGFEMDRIKESWGLEPNQALSKKQIADIAESNYKTVAENVKMNLEKIGIRLEAWESCNIFPPVISQRILEILG